MNTSSELLRTKWNAIANTESGEAAAERRANMKAEKLALAAERRATKKGNMVLFSAITQAERIHAATQGN